MKEIEVKELSVSLCEMNYHLEVYGFRMRIEKGERISLDVDHGRAVDIHSDDIVIVHAEDKCFIATVYGAVNLSGSEYLGEKKRLIMSIKYIYSK